MRALLINPENPESFWSYKEVLRFMPGRSSFPPLGLLTVAAMLPADWQLTLVDLNVGSLSDEQIRPVDMVIVGGMSAQSEGIDQAVRRAKAMGKRILMGGPHATHFAEQYRGVADYIILGECEETLPRFLKDLEAGTPQPVYRAEGFPELTLTPPPRWDLIDFSNYLSMLLQFSRGCPFDCEFCDIVVLNGRRPRHKTPEQVRRELSGLRDAGWRGHAMITDDNFIGVPARAREILGTMIQWQKENGYPFNFVTQASINLAKDPELLHMMVEADFRQVFLGIETPLDQSLAECGKKHNQNLDMVAAVHLIQEAGIEVLGGFIVGFDSDPPEVFEVQERFIEEASLPVAMVGMLTAGPGSRLWNRLEKEGRLRGATTGNNTMDPDAVNFWPTMGLETLIQGYAKLLDRLYRPPNFYSRALMFFEHFHPQLHGPAPMPSRAEIIAFFKMLWSLGVVDRHRRAFWSYLVRSLRGKYDMGKVMYFAAVGFHLWKTSELFIQACAARRPTDTGPGREPALPVRSAA